MSEDEGNVSSNESEQSFLSETPRKQRDPNVLGSDEEFEETDEEERQSYLDPLKNKNITQESESAIIQAYKRKLAEDKIRELIEQEKEQPIPSSNSTPLNSKKPPIKQKSTSAATPKTKRTVTKNSRAFDASLLEEDDVELPFGLSNLTNSKTSADSKIKYLIKNENLSLESTNAMVPIDECLEGQIIRKLEKKHVDFLVKTLKDIGKQKFIDTVLYGSLLIGYRGEDGKVYLAEGNHRTAAIKKCNMESEDGDKIKEIKINFIFAEEPSLKVASLLCTISSCFATQNCLAYSPPVIVSLCRTLMLDDEKNYFKLQDILNAKQDPKRKLEPNLPRLLSTALNVNATKIPNSIWRCCLIENEAQFKEMLNLLGLVSSNSRIFEKVCNAYQRRKVAMLSFAKDKSLKNYTASEIEENMEKSVVGQDWHYTLKLRHSWDEGKDEAFQKSKIMGDIEAGKEGSDQIFEKFLATEIAARVTDTARYKNVEQKQKYLKEKFQKYLLNASTLDDDMMNDENNEQPPAKRRRVKVCKKKNCKHLKENASGFSTTLDESQAAAFKKFMEFYSCPECIEDTFKSNT